MQTEITPTPTAEEAAAIVAAVEALWPKPYFAGDSAPSRRAPVWRFSNRWWARPVPTRRGRPYR